MTRRDEVGVNGGVYEEDVRLARRAQAGDDRAFDGLVDRHYARCLRYAWRLLGNRADAEEAVQDTFVRAYRSLDACAPERVAGWITRILVNRCRTYARRMRLRPAPVPMEAVRGSAGAQPPALPPDDLSHTPVGRALERLSPRLREAFLLKHVEQLTHEEIAALTGASVSAVKMRVKRAADALARLLEEADD